MLRFFSILCIALLVYVSPCAAAGEANSFLSCALYIDTSGQYVPGADLLAKGLNEVIRYKLNALFLGSEIHSGNEVLRGLKRHGVTDASSATPEALQAYCSSSYVNHVLLFTANPLEFSLDVKLYSGGDGAYLLDHRLSRPNSTEVLSVYDTFSLLLSSQIDQVKHLIKPEA